MAYFTGAVSIVRCRTTMVAPQGMVLITIPVNLPIEDGLVDQGKLFTVSFCSQLLETRLLKLLRFQFGEARSPPPLQRDHHPNLA